MAIDLQALGFTQEEIQQRVIDQIVQQVMYEDRFDEDGEPIGKYQSTFAAKISEQVKKRIDQVVEKMGDEHVLPNVFEMLKSFTIQTTNNYGEPKAPPMTISEYLVKRAGEYMSEKVSNKGEGQWECSSYDRSSWSGTQTRIAHMIHSHLSEEISKVMKAALADANSKIAQGIYETCRIKLNEILSSVKVDVKTK